MMLQLEELSVGYNGKPVLENINLTFDRPQLVSILGPNGVGKSTLVQCIDNILQPISGRMLLNGKEIKEYDPKELATMIGYVPCTSTTSFPMSVADTVLIGRYPRSGRNRTERDLRIVHSALKLMGIEDLALRNFNELSAGQHQKVVLARGLVQETEILILDEPTSNLDVKHQIGVSKLLRLLAHKKNLLVIMISHDLNIASKFSDRIILLGKGSVYADGTPTEVLTRDNIRDIYDLDTEIIDKNGHPYIVISDDNDTVIDEGDLDGLFERSG